jgi:hypothetical protein
VASFDVVISAQAHADLLGHLALSQTQRLRKAARLPQLTSSSFITRNCL